MAHTAGEWAFRKNGHDNFTITTDYGDIADVYAPEDAVEGEDLDNAKLIAAAPNMIKAIENMLFTLSEQLTEDAMENESIIDAYNECSKILFTVTGKNYEL